MSTIYDVMNKIMTMVPKIPERQPEGQSEDPKEKEKLFFPDEIIEIISTMSPSPGMIRESGTGYVILPNQEEQPIDEDSMEPLGTYHRMSSKGRITLYWKNIGSFFWHTIYDMINDGIRFNKNDMYYMNLVVVDKTYFHERFHHFCDVCSHMFGSGFHRYMEEALAVAWSYHSIGWARSDGRTCESRLPKHIYNELMDRIYQYTARGYRDWINYKDKESLEFGILDYLPPPDRNFLVNSGVPLGKLITHMMYSFPIDQQIEYMAP